jgi:hypothetical protein
VRAKPPPLPTPEKLARPVEPARAMHGPISGEPDLGTHRQRDPDSEPPTPRLPMGYQHALKVPPLPDAAAPEPPRERPPELPPIPPLPMGAEPQAPPPAPPMNAAALEVLPDHPPLAQSVPAFAHAKWWRRPRVWLMASLATLALLAWGVLRARSDQTSAAGVASSPPASSVAAAKVPAVQGAEHAPPSSAESAETPSGESSAPSMAVASEEPRPTASLGQRAARPAAPAQGAARRAPSTAPAPPAEEPSARAEFDSAAAASSLSAAAAQASGCRKPGDPTGSQAVVVVTFAPSGRVTSAVVTGKPFAGTETGGCIAATIRRAQVPAFSGERITVSKTVAIR